MIQKLKPCDGECEGKLRKIWRSKDRKKYCQICWYKMEAKVKELMPSKPEAETKKQYKIRSRSPKRSEEEKIYTSKRIIFLNENPICKMKIPGLCVTKANTVQHLKGRIGDLLLDTKFWIPACLPCHQYATDHPAEAIDNGWSLLRNAK